MALRSLNRSPGVTVDPAGMLEPLEGRTLFGGSPFPQLTDLENQNDTVVRITTNHGDIDIELLDSVAPGTVTNFLHYVRDGDYDGTFFHRLINSPTPFVLQGGQARFTDANGLSNIPVDAPIANEHTRPNVIRTLAMAKLPNDPNSATSQFFFNLDDNTDLDTQNGGFTVFAKVINNSSWDVVTQISGLRSVNGGAGFTNVPVEAGYVTGDPITEADLVFITDAEIIKPGGTPAFYLFHDYYPEGFAGSTINEFLPMGNAGDAPVAYQVIVPGSACARGRAPARNCSSSRSLPCFASSITHKPSFGVAMTGSFRCSPLA